MVNETKIEIMTQVKVYFKEEISAVMREMKLQMKEQIKDILMEMIPSQRKGKA